MLQMPTQTHSPIPERPILVVDDDAKIVRLVRTYLERDGFSVVTAADGPAALDAIERHRPALVVLDLMLPELDGRAVIRAVRRDDEVAATPILIISARGSTLAQVLGNIISNTVRYTPAGGTVTVRAERGATDLLVSIANTGDGIPPADLERVFERFYRVEKSRDRARGGAGIGLAIVKQLVEAGGGRVGAESREGQTRFWFSLPV